MIKKALLKGKRDEEAVIANRNKTPRVTAKYTTQLPAHKCGEVLSYSLSHCQTH